MNIAEFLTARLDEDQAVALAAQDATRGIWTQTDPIHEPGRVEDDYGDVVTYDESSPSEDQARHIACHDPARVLAEVAAKRAILAMHVPFVADHGPLDGRECCEAESVGEDHFYAMPWPCDTLKWLALPYADHPDYLPAWRVEE